MVRSITEGFGSEGEAKVKWVMADSFPSQKIR